MWAAHDEQLEAAGIDSRRLYARHGYKDMQETIPFPDGVLPTAMDVPDVAATRVDGIAARL